MHIYYCDRCGKLISRADQALYPHLNEDSPEKLCKACNPMAAISPGGTTTALPTAAAIGARPKSGEAHTRSTTRHVAAGIAPGTGRHPSTRDPHPIQHTNDERQPSSRSKKDDLRYLWIGMGVAGVILAVLLVVLFSSKKQTPAVAQKPTQPAQNTPPPRNPDPNTPNPTQTPTPLQVQTTQPPNQPTPVQNPTQPVPVTDPAPAEQPKQELSVRDQFGFRILEEIKAWKAQNPNDPWTYKSKLNNLSQLYGSSPAAVEARKLLEELKNLPPQPDRIELVPESKTYQLVYDVDLANPKVYLADNHTTTKPFDRIAYFLEIQSNDEVSYLYVSMDAFTDDAGKIGIPFASLNVKFQQNVTNMNVYSNAKGIVTGTGITTGNIEFWASNYGPQNSSNVPNAANDKFDFGDGGAGFGDGYGCMQVHNYEARQTLFAFNKWNAGNGADLGIGNNPSGNPDWTFSGSASRYKMKRLRVLVHQK